MAGRAWSTVSPPKRFRLALLPLPSSSVEGASEAGGDLINTNQQLIPFISLWGIGMCSASIGWMLLWRGIHSNLSLSINKPLTHELLLNFASPPSSMSRWPVIRGGHSLLLCPITGPLPQKRLLPKSWIRTEQLYHIFLISCCVECKAELLDDHKPWSSSVYMNYWMIISNNFRVFTWDWKQCHQESQTIQTVLGAYWRRKVGWQPLLPYKIPYRLAQYV